MPVPPFEPLLPTLRAVGDTLRLDAGVTLFRAGERPQALHWVVAGELRLLRPQANGGEVILQRCRSGPFAEASLYSAAYHCDGVAALPTEAIRISKARFDGLMDDPGFVRHYLRQVALELRGLRARCERLSLPRAADRVLHALADGGPRPFGGEGETLKAWAGELGLSHEALYRSLAALEREGRVRRRDGVVVAVTPGDPVNG